MFVFTAKNTANVNTVCVIYARFKFFGPKIISLFFHEREIILDGWMEVGSTIFLLLMSLLEFCGDRFWK